MCIKWEACVARDREVIHRKRVEHLVRLNLARRCTSGADFGKAVGDEEDEYDEVAVGRAFDLEVAEEGVGAEEVESFVEDIGFICSSWFGELS